MPTFTYTARDEKGATRNGSLEATDSVEAADVVRRQGLWIITMEQRGLESAFTESQRPQQVRKNALSPIVGRIALPSLAMFFRQFNTLINAGVPMHSALESLTRQTRDKKLQKIVIDLARGILSGEQLSKGMARYPQVFEPLVLNLVKAGEEGGILQRALGQIADYIEKEIELRRMLNKVTLYPKLMLFAAVFIPAVVNLMLAYIKAHNPDANIINLGGFLNSAQLYYVLIPTMIVVFCIFRYGSQSHEFNSAWDGIKLRIPFTGYTLRQMAMAKFGRALGALYAGGLSLPRSIAVAADACGNAYIQNKIKPAAMGVEQGEHLTPCLARTGCFPPMVLDMVATGEQTGDLDKMLFSIADYYEAEANAKSHMAGTVLGVVVLFLVACYVAYIVAMFWMHYFNTLLGGSYG